MMWAQTAFHDLFYEAYCQLHTLLCIQKPSPRLHNHQYCLKNANHKFKISARGLHFAPKAHCPVSQETRET